MDKQDYPPMAQMLREQGEQVLDHGYLKFIEVWGSDERIIEAARMSTNKGFLGWGSPEKPGDEKLLRFLWEGKHATPFEMAGAIIEVQAPILVFREWHRHRTQSFNELSARYTPMPDLNYLPTVERLLVNSQGSNKQANRVQGAEALDEAHARLFLKWCSDLYEQIERCYQESLSMGVPKELARIIIPVGRYSRMRASANLRNWLAFMTLREAPNAQYEIRQYANVLHKFLAPAFPRTIALYERSLKLDALATKVLSQVSALFEKEPELVQGAIRDFSGPMNDLRASWKEWQETLKAA